MNKSKSKPTWSLVGSIFLLGFAGLALELIQVRMLSFFLGSVSNFLAIPIALLGLALGSIFYHYVGPRQNAKIVPWFQIAVFWVMLGLFLLLFFVTNQYFPIIHAVYNQPVRAAAKLIVYSVIFLPAYFLLGTLLSAYFTNHADKIGQVYFYDLAGAALGCLTVPVVFTFSSLPEAIGLLLLSGALLGIVHKSGRKKPLLIVTMVMLVSVEIGAFSGLLFKEKPNIGILCRSLMGQMPPDQVEEISARWNEIARTSLIRQTAFSQKNQVHRAIVVQDDGMSNVWFEKYKSNKSVQDIQNRHLHQSIPFDMGLPAQKILVMFAGVGKDMVLLDRLYNGQADITGVELNSAVVDAAYNPNVADHNLPEFFARPNIHMVVEEGRDFLNKNTDKYDLIFVATNGAVNATRTGHTRKYLDTYEAMKSYMDHLNDDGMIVFVNQPVRHKLYAFKKLFAERNIPNFPKAIIAFGYPNDDFLQSLIVRPKGLTAKDIQVVRTAIFRTDRRQQFYLAGDLHARPDFTAALDADPAHVEQGLLTDDKPFWRKVTLDDFTLIPTEQQMLNPLYAANWIKVFTVLLFTAVCLLIMAVVRFTGKKENRLPLLWLLYFLASGISYMLVEIGLIAKTELFMGNPLYAVAVILAAFLLSNSVGAYLQDRFKLVKGPLTMVVYNVTAIAISISLAQIFNDHLLSIPLLAKIALVFLAVAPAGVTLGTFFPMGVQTLVGTGKENTTPLCYAMATLSSVLGSTFAMTAITNVGFSTVVALGAAGYTLTATIFFVARKFA